MRVVTKFAARYPRAVEYKVIARPGAVFRELFGSVDLFPASRLGYASGVSDSVELAFADCVLKLDAHQLFRRGIEVPLEPKVFTLLEVLIQRRPAVVTYIELDELLWPNVYVARSSLARIVSELRTVLGDSPTDSHIIRTVYKTGYAFAATVTTPGGTSASGDVRPASVTFSLRWNQQLLTLLDGPNIAGRDADCAVIVDASTVSRRHARFTIAAGVATVEDLGSTNGTYVNEVAIKGLTRLHHGDAVKLGRALLEFRAIEPAAPTEMVTRAPA